MRIVHVSDCYLPRTGGIESQVSDLAAAQQSAGHEVHVLTATLGAAGARGGVVEPEGGVVVHRLGARMPFDLPVSPVQARMLRTALAALAPDVVHVHAGVLSPFAFDGARIALAQRLPTAITWHCMLDGVVPGVRAGARVLHWPSDRAALSAVSHAAAERVEEAFGVPVAVVPNGMDLSRWAPVAEQPWSGPGDPVHLVTTMRLAPRKRAVPLIRVVAAAVDELGPGRVRLSVIGDGPARGGVEAAVSRYGLQDVVDLRGRLPREGVRAAYADADVFLAAARLESFGIAALEARTAGLAVVAHRGTGIEEFVTDGVDGLLVEDDAQMAEAVVRFVRDRGLLERVLEHNRAVRPDFSWKTVLQAASGEYERAIALSGHPGDLRMGG